MKWIVFKRRDKWFYGIASLAFLGSIAVILVGWDHFGSSLAVGVF